MGGGSSASRAAKNAQATASAQQQQQEQRQRQAEREEQEQLKLEREWLERERELENERGLDFYSPDADYLDEVSDDGLTPRGPIDDENRQSWGLISNSLGMDQDDLLFNMLYFNPEGGVSMGAAINNALEETVALHSESNTPYKLRPASLEEMRGLSASAFARATPLDHEEGPSSAATSAPRRQDATPTSTPRRNQPQPVSSSSSSSSSSSCAPSSSTADCSVCREEFEPGCAVLALPNCGHAFHDDCLRKWLGYQNWCPVCRTEIGPGGAGGPDSAQSKARRASAEEDARVNARGGDDCRDRDRNREREQREHFLPLGPSPPGSSSSPHAMLGREDSYERKEDSSTVC